MVQIDLQGMSMEEYCLLFEDLGEQKFRAKQLFQWVYQKGATDFVQMSNLSKGLRQKLSQAVAITSLKIQRKLVSQQDDTVKFLLSLPDGETVETVRMSYTGRESRDRHTVCVSSQVGCAMGCVFCATGLSGWKRNLTTGEIVGQVLTVQRDLRVNLPEAKVTNVVFMGMGEPLLNYENVLKAIRILNEPAGLNIGLRRITLSTCGVVPQIKKLAQERLPIVLAVSLHAPTDELRNELLPINKKYPLQELMEACAYYIELTGRRITFEYALIAGKNDSRAHARALAKLLKGMLANVNLIPLNSVAETGLVRSGESRIKTFAKELEDAGIEAAIREEKGGDIEAACGQLRRRGVK
ncbi:23S rRNA (adenine(2503)-C(2))-methyltransferase RlmN [Zhaonella formicivorans]|uniref:23S rRNA (adenine(2503)-C(2))-methyltransferase RlmN n=1 Tax=Zhaonella formicivorans TaxID=2528593 RepID=UPI0010D25D46|nr:23S rRNA (adenine(2503)-C(2))-methyltransferase RlmN [Zhaonella formicivorans]